MNSTAEKTGEIVNLQDVKLIELSDIQKQASEAAQKELDAYKKELENKKYYADLSVEDTKVLQEFLLNDAPWTFTEALGINEVNKELTESLKSKKMFMKSTAYEAMYFYLSKVSGSGKKVSTSSISDVDTYLRLLKGINAVRASISNDSEKLRELEYVATCRAEGLDPENIDKG